MITFELKHDGFRALAYLENGACRLISRNGQEFKGFRPLCESICSSLNVKNAVLDGEIFAHVMGRATFGSRLRDGNAAD